MLSRTYQMLSQPAKDAAAADPGNVWLHCMRMRRLEGEAIRDAIEHDRSTSKDRGEQEELKRRYATLTARERDVMDLVVSGLLNKQSAAERGALRGKKKHSRS